jgi:hypothetical protein
VKVIIAGSRDITDMAVLLAALGASPWADSDDCLLYDGAMTEVVSGTARGVDTLAIEWAVINWFPWKEFPADWERHGKAAGYIRNRQMAEYADALLAIWDGKSRGTKNMIETMEKLGKPVYVYRTDQEKG